MNKSEAIGSREGMAAHRYNDRLERGGVEVGVGNDGEKRVDDCTACMRRGRTGDD